MGSGRGTREHTASGGDTGFRGDTGAASHLTVGGLPGDGAGWKVSAQTQEETWDGREAPRGWRWG